MEYRESDHTWLALDNGEEVILTTYYFNISEFNRVLNQAQLNALSDRVDALEP